MQSALAAAPLVILYKQYVVRFGLGYTEQSHPRRAGRRVTASRSLSPALRPASRPGRLLNQGPAFHSHGNLTPMQLLKYIDNYDSFIFNLVQFLGRLGVEQVWRNSSARLSQTTPAIADQVDRILLSQGCRARGTGRRVDRPGACLRTFAPPLLECAWAARPSASRFGATVDQAPVVHGENQVGVFPHRCRCAAGISGSCTATRYHSLTIFPETLPTELEVTTHTRSGVIMGVQHTDLPIHGVQFHPESILTEGGHRMLANWLADCGQVRDDALVRRLESEIVNSLATVRHSADDAVSSGSSGPALSAIDRTSA